MCVCVQRRKCVPRVCVCVCYESEVLFFEKMSLSQDRISIYPGHPKELLVPLHTIHMHTAHARMSSGYKCHLILLRKSVPVASCYFQSSDDALRVCCMQTLLCLR